MKKVIISLLALTTIYLVTAQPAVANEGVFQLGGSGEASCYALSVYDDGRYDILMSCDRLKTPFSAEQNRYLVWVEDAQGDVDRLGEINRGKLEESIGRQFNKMFVTAESKRTPRSPSGEPVVEATIEDIPFGTEGQEQAGEEMREAEEEVDEGQKVDEADQQADQKPKEEQKSTFGGVLRTIGRVLLIALVVLLGVVIVMTVVTRRKGGV